MPVPSVHAMTFSALIFDMDGLMLDSERVYQEIFNRAAGDCGIEFPLALHELLLGRNTADTKAILRDLWRDDAFFDRFMDCCRRHHDVCFAVAPPAKPGLHALLDYVEARGLPKAVATSTPRKRAVPLLEKAGLLHRFASVSTGDEVERGKPAPDVFLKAAATLGVAPRHCLVLEDSEAGVTGAHAAGMTVCMVPDVKQPQPQVRALAQGVYPSLVEVQAFLHARLSGRAGESAGMAGR